MSSYTLGNGIVVTRSHDTDYRLQALEDAGTGAIQHLDFDYDRRGNITVRDDLVASVPQTFGYDEMSRLTSATGAYGSQGFTYDGVGNRLTLSGTASETYDYATDSHHLTSLGSGATVLYDDAGHIESKGVLSLSYNEAHRSATVALGGATVTNVYGASGQRITKTVSGVTTVFSYDRGGQLLAETSSGSLREYVWLGDIPLAQYSAAGLAYFHVDQLNTPQKMTDASQALVWQASYTPFGEASVTSSGGFDNPLRFPGQYFDAETGLHQNWHRDYDPSIGRYLQSDPVGLEGGLSTYAYAYGNPTRYIDPTGETPWGLIFAGADLAWQLYENDGNLRCVDWASVGLSMLGGGLLNALGKGAFRFKTVGSHTWDATSSWMNRRGVQALARGQQRHHWLLERNQGIGAGVHDAIKNQPWNTNPISAGFNNWLSRHPNLSWLGAPSWVPEMLAAPAIATQGDECNDECSK